MNDAEMETNHAKRDMEMQVRLMRKLKKSVNFKGVFKGVPVVPEALNFTRDCLKHSFSIRHFDFGLALGPHLHGVFGLFIKGYTLFRYSPYNF